MAARAPDRTESAGAAATTSQTGSAAAEKGALERVTCLCRVGSSALVSLHCASGGFGATGSAEGRSEYGRLGSRFMTYSFGSRFCAT